MLPASTRTSWRQIRDSKLILRLFADVVDKLHNRDFWFFEMIVEFLGGVFVTLVGIKFYIGKCIIALVVPPTWYYQLGIYCRKLMSNSFSEM